MIFWKEVRLWILAWLKKLITVVMIDFFCAWPLKALWTIFLRLNRHQKWLHALENCWLINSLLLEMEITDLLAAILWMVSWICQQLRLLYLTEDSVTLQSSAYTKTLFMWNILSYRIIKGNVSKKAYRSKKVNASPLASKPVVRRSCVYGIMLGFPVRFWRWSGCRRCCRR